MKASDFLISVLIGLPLGSALLFAFYLMGEPRAVWFVGLIKGIFGL